MKIIGVFFLVVLFISCSTEENKTKQAVPATTQTYDSLLALQYGADEYGMKEYVMAFLKSGPNRNQDSLEAMKLQQAHMDNINRMAEEGKLLVAGPFLDNGDVRGIYIFNVKTIEEAKALTATDPAIKAGRLVMELHPWYGPASFMAIDSLQKKVTKKSF